MELQRLRLTNFRNDEALDLTLRSGLSIFGTHRAGKTNLLKKHRALCHRNASNLYSHDPWDVFQSYAGNQDFFWSYVGIFRG